MGGIPLRRVYGASAAIYLAALLVSLRFGSLAVSLGVTAGTALALGILASWQLVIPAAFDPRSPRRGLAIAIGLGKLPVLGAIVYVLIGREWVSAPAFAVGFLVPQAAIALLAVGAMAAKKKATEDATHAAPRG